MSATTQVKITKRVEIERPTLVFCPHCGIVMDIKLYISHILDCESDRP